MGSQPSIIEPSVVLEQQKKKAQAANVPVRVLDTQELSCQQMEMEFDKIYEKSKEILGSISKNPCHELTQRITECLENNNMKMGKCFSVMDEYRLCVKDNINERLAEHADKEAIHRAKVHEIEQSKDTAQKEIQETLHADKVDGNSPEKIGDQAHNKD